ncbi:MAG: hypothetical protein MJ085_04850 [Clostridia bacterium]|nr:hypothetical protein [Clostridia bacterium]
MKQFRTVCIILALVLMIGMFAVGCKRPGQKSEYLVAVENYYAAISDNDFTKLQKAIPPQAIDALGMNETELSSKTASYSDIYGGNFTISIKEKGSRQLDKAQCNDLAAYLRGDYGITEPIQDAYLAEFKLKVSGEKGKQEILEAYVVYKIGGEWFMDLWADANVESIRAIYDAD